MKNTTPTKSAPPVCTYEHMAEEQHTNVDTNGCKRRSQSTDRLLTEQQRDPCAHLTRNTLSQSQHQHTLLLLRTLSSAPSTTFPTWSWCRQKDTSRAFSEDLTAAFTSNLDLQGDASPTALVLPLQLF